MSAPLAFPPLALSPALDVAIALSIAALAVAWMVRSAVRTFARRRAGGCGCASSGACPAASAAVRRLREAARRSRTHAR